ncbi:MAG: hypothetical protein MR051_06950 [Lentisphaeria bacterium]|nr:hypothetical protein [Lentisphaeria bacterium]
MTIRTKVFVCTFGFAAAVRGVFAYLVSVSMFRNYHRVAGLDMQTLLRFAEWGNGGPGAVPFFSPHRLLLGLDWLMRGGSHSVGTIFAVQALLGALGCAAVADMMLSFTGKRRGALIAGGIAALYLPALIYEFSVLQDSFALNFTLFAVWGTLRAWKRRFAPAPAALCALLWSLAMTGRPTALGCAAAFGGWSLWQLHRRGLIRRAILPAALVCILLGAYSAFNRRYGWDFSPFYQVMPYTRVSNAAPGAPPATVWQVTLHAAGRSPRLFSAREIPENHNLYFWCEKLPVLHAFPAPGALLPCAVAATAALITAGAFRRRFFWYIFIPILTLALPLCAREAIGRYRLTLTPYLILAAVTGFYAFRKLPVRRQALALLLGGTAAMLSLLDARSAPRVRAEDYHAWALAVEATPGAGKQAILNAFGDYWQETGFRSAKAFRAIVDRALQFRDLPLSAAIVTQAYRNGISPDLVGYYHGWIFMLADDPASVERIYSRIDPRRLPSELRPTYRRVRGDARKLLHKRTTRSIL